MAKVRDWLSEHDDESPELLAAIDAGLRSLAEKGARIVTRDITHRKRIEKALVHAQKIDSIGNLAGGIAHDYNNILSAILMNLDLLGQENAGQEVRRITHNLRAHAHQASTLTRQLLLFSRRETMRARDLDLNELLNEFMKILRRLVRQNVQIELIETVDNVRIHADPGMMEQILVNLAVNSRDAMPQGGSIIITTEAVSIDASHAETHPEAQTGEFVCIAVGDTGTGIYPEYLPRIFEPFFTTKEAGKGTGFGLATVYGIVKQHRGWIEVTSQVGTGTTFKIFLPASASNAAKKSTPKIGTIPARGHEKILLVEDDADVRMVTRGFLEGSGYEIWEAANGLEALNVWKTNASQIDLLLTDFIMPGGLNGWELADRLRGDRPGLKVILMSGYNSDLSGKIQPHSHILPKPFSWESLTETVRSCLDTARPAG